MENGTSFWEDGIKEEDGGQVGFIDCSQAEGALHVGLEVGSQDPWPFSALSPWEKKHT